MTRQDEGIVAAQVGFGMGTNEMVWLRTLLLAAASLLTWAAIAAPPPAPSPEEAAQIEGRICAQICRQRFEACAKSGLAAEIKAATCETDVIVCTVNCPTCVGAYAKCTREQGAAGPACKAPFAACMRSVVASGASSRPLIRFGGGDGATRETAVVITGARGEDEGIVAELVWAGKTHPMWHKATQALIQAGGKAYDKVGYTAPDGPHEAWFDIGGFFGKK